MFSLLYTLMNKILETLKHIITSSMNMATKRIDNNNPDELSLVLNNGDKEKFEQLIKDWNFKDEQSLLRFMLAIMLMTEDNIIGIMNKGIIEKVAPQDKLLNYTT